MGSTAAMLCYGDGDGCVDSSSGFVVSGHRLHRLHIDRLHDCIDCVDSSSRPVATFIDRTA
jgi:hypothetical protein